MGTQAVFSDLTFIDATTVPLPKHQRSSMQHLRSYATKAYALYISSFEEVLMLDSDNMPLADPATLFEVT